MKILFTTHNYLGEESGARTHVFALLQGWARAGHSIVTAAPFGRKWDGSGSALRCGRSGYANGNALLSAITLLWQLTLLALRTKQQAKKADLVYARDNFAGYFASLRVLNPKPFIREVNGNVARERELRSTDVISRLYNKVAIACDRRSLSCCTKAIFVSDGLLNEYAKEDPELKSKSFVIPNGVNCEHFRPLPELRNRVREELGLEKDFVFVFTGSMRPYHGLETLIRAFAFLSDQSPKSRLLLIGDGIERERIEALCYSLEVADRVKWLGRVEHDLIPRLLAAADVCVCCHRAGVLGAPIKVVEYLAAGKPVIQSAIPGTQFIEDNKLGLLFDPDNANDLAMKMLKSMNEIELAEIGRAARAYAETNLDWEKIVQRVIAVCEDAIK